MSPHVCRFPDEGRGCQIPSDGTNAASCPDVALETVSKQQVTDMRRSATARLATRLSALVTVLALCTSPASAQRLRVHVVDERGKSLAGATVAMFGVGLPADRERVTDEQGWTAFSDAPASGTVGARKVGHIRPDYADRFRLRASRLFNLTEGSVGTIELVLPRGAAIAGRVRHAGETGRVRAWVSVLAWRFHFGKRVLQDVGGVETTPDGRFELTGLAPGSYFVAAQDTRDLRRGQVRNAPARTFFPGTVVPDAAQAVHVAAGATARLPLFSTRFARRTRLRGRVVAGNGAPMTEVAVYAESMVERPYSPGNSLAELDGRGHFELYLRPGTYEVTAYSGIDGHSGSAEVRVGTADRDDIVIATSPPAIVRGHVVFDRAATAPLTPEGFDLSFIIAPLLPQAWPRMFAGGLVRIRDDWSFEGTASGGHLQLSGSGGGKDHWWQLKSVLQDGTDVLWSGLTLPPGTVVTGIQAVFTDRHASVSGHVLDRAGVRIPEAMVIVWSADPSVWGSMLQDMRVTEPDQSGGFTVTGLLPGHYLMVAVDEFQDGREWDVEWLRAMRDVATPLTIVEDDRKELNLTRQRGLP